MHGYNSRSDVVVNAEVDSMGGFVDGGVGIGLKTSPRRAAIEKAQADLRQEYDVREERRRELEFLEKGGNPLDFKIGNAASLSVQSTSLTGHHVAEHLVNSEAKGSFALTASPRGDSVESIGRPGVATVCEANTADNFDGENEIVVGQRRFKKTCRRSAELPVQIDVLKNVKDSDDSAIFRPYARRNRSKPNRDGARTSVHDIVQGSNVMGTSAASTVVKDSKVGISDSNDQKIQSSVPLSVPKFPTSNGDSNIQAVSSDSQVKNEVVADGNEDLCPIGDFSRGQIADGRHNDPPVLLVDAGTVLDGKDNTAASSTDVLNDEAKNMEVGTGLLGNVNDKLDRMKGVEIGSLLETKDDGLTGKHLVDANRSSGSNNAFDDSSRSSEKCASEFEVHGDSLNGTGIENNDDSRASDILIATSREFPSANANHSINCPTGEDSKLSDVKIQCSEKTDIEMGENKNLSSEFSKGAVDRGNGSALQISVESIGEDLKESALPQKISASRPDLKCSSDNDIKSSDKARDDSILEEARTIETKRKRIAELSVVSSSVESRGKSHWDFVLEEMAWLAYDFSQERLWKKTAVAQVGRRVAMSSSLRSVEHNRHGHLRRLACTLAKAVMQFWHSAETHNWDSKASVKQGNQDLGAFGSESSKNDARHFDEKKQHTVDRNIAIKDYAARFLAYNCSFASQVHVESSKSIDRVESSWTADNRMEESLFYAIPTGAMQIYRTSVESHVLQIKKKFNNLREKADSMADYSYSGMEFAEEEGETSNYYTHGEYSNMTKHEQKKLKNVGRPFSVRPYKQAPESMYGHTINSQQYITLSKKSANNYGVGSILPKRIRTASRQRIIGNPGVAAPPQISAKTDVSSGDTNSFQDDPSAQHQKSVEVESVGDFGKQMAYEFTDASKPRKKKKTKHLDSAYDQLWQSDSVVPHDNQKGTSKKRRDHLMFDSSCASGLYGQSAGKKPKLMKQNTENSFDNIVPISGSIPSPAASQMSNMSNTNKFVKMFNGRERVRKSKIFKITSGQSDSGSPWSLFEDQALVVLVHDMGPNWELVSDAMNNTLQFKCIFRNPKECKDRHKILMDKGAGDGADSAEDSGSSQSYPSTLPGIPKGSARQLFQRLQGPVEEDTLKSHFEMIIMIEKKQHSRRIQNDHRDGMQPVPPHNSHMIALSQVCPNNLNGGILTPLDLCEPNPASSDALSLGFHNSLGNNILSPGQTSNIQTLPNSAPSSCLPSSSGVAHGSSSQSPSIQPNSTLRDGRYNVSRGPVSTDEQHRIQQYNQMLSARNAQNLSAPGSLPTADRGGVRLLSGGNGMPMMPRNSPIPRPGIQGMTSSPMVNSGSMISPAMPPAQSPTSMHPGPSNSMMRPHFMRPGHNDQQHQAQNTQTNGQGFNAMSSGFSNQVVPPSGQGYPVPHPHQQPHVLNNPHHPASQQQAFAIRLAKERQLQQQRLIQQQQQFATSGAMMTHPQTQSQLPLSSPMQINQIPTQTSSQSVSVSPSTSSPMNSVSASQKHNGVGRGSQGGTSGSTNQGVKPRNRQQSVASGRNHPQQRPSPQNPKASKGLGRGNIMVHQNLVDHSHLNGLSIPQGSDKGEQVMNMIQPQGMYSASGMVGVQPPKAVPSPKKPQATLTKQASLSNSDGSTQTPVLPATSGHGLPTQQAALTHGVPPNHSHFQQQIHQKQPSHPHQNVQRVVQPIYKTSSDQGPTDPEVPSDVSIPSTSGASGAQPPNDAVAGVPVSPQAWNNPDTLMDSVVSNPNPLQSGGNETVGSLNHGLNGRQLSGNLSKAVPSQPLYHLQEQQVEQDSQSPRKQ